MKTTTRDAGFSLAELLTATMVASLLAAMMFQLFHQNERVLRDQTLIMEMQQTTRIVASQIADEIRMAGQGVPVYSASFDSAPSEAAAVFLSSSTINRIDFRAGFSNVEAASTMTVPADFSLGVSRTIPVADTNGLAAGRYVYLSAPSSWTWLRAEITSVGAFSLTVTPRDWGNSNATVHFTARPAVDLEEAVSIYLSGGIVRRAAASSTTNASNPVWGAANEIGRNVTKLVFTYYDRAGNAIQPTTLSNRVAIARVDFELTAETAAPLSNGTRPKYSLAMRALARNQKLRPAPM